VLSNAFGHITEIVLLPQGRAHASGQRDEKGRWSFGGAFLICARALPTRSCPRAGYPHRVKTIQKRKWCF